MMLSCGFKINSSPDDEKNELDKLQNFNSVFAFTDNSWTAPYTYDFSELEALVAWSLKHNKFVLMDGVIWRCRVPKWLRSTQFSQKEFFEMTLDYVRRVIEHPFFSYDLLSELFNYEGLPTGNFWHEILGDNYLRDILEYASIGKGSSKLIISDFGIKLNKKWEGIIRFLHSIKDQKLIDGVSIQVHVNVIPGFNRHSLLDKIKPIQDLGYEVIIPEIVCWENIYFPAGHILQGKIYHEIIDICLENKISVEQPSVDSLTSRIL